MTGSFGQSLDAAMQTGYVAAYRWLGDRDEARDACQEAAVRALAAKRRYDPTRGFYPWFYRILKNHCMDRLKARRRLPESISADSHAEPVGAIQSVEQRLMTTEREQAVAAAIERLPDDLRELIELRHFQDLSYREIGEVLDCPAGTVMSRLYRARKQLRELLADDLGLRRAANEAEGRP